MTHTLELIELAGGVPALHPERKGSLDRSKLKNWVEKNGGLPPYINSVATAILRENPSWSISRVIATAVNWAKKTCATGQAFGGKVKVSAAVQKAACNAVKQWEAKKAKASIEFDKHLLELSSEEFREAQWEARVRNSFREAGTDLPDLINMSDNLYLRFAESDDMTNLVELSFNSEEVNDMNNTEALIQVMELSAGAQSAVMAPFNLSSAEKVGKGRYKKEILKVGEIVVDKTGRTFNFTSDFLKGLAQNFKKNPVDYVPFLFTDKNDAHTMTANPHTYGGKVVELSLDSEDDPQKLYGTFELTEDTEKVVEHNPKYGVSVTAHPNYVDVPRGEYYGPTLLNVAATHYPKMTKMGEWQKASVMASSEPIDFQVINLSMESFVDDNNIGDDVKEENMPPENEAPLQLSSEQLTQLLESDAVKTAIAKQVEDEVKAKDDKIVELSNQIGEIRNDSYSKLVEAALNTYNTNGDGKGVPPIVLDYAKALMLSMGSEERDEVVTLSTGSGDEAKEVSLNKVQLITKMLDEIKGTLDLSSEQGSEDDQTEEQRTASHDAGVNWLLEMTGNPVAAQS
jgi:hypothetical protein